MEILLIIVWIGLGFWGAHIAGNRNRNKTAWGILCAMFGIFAVLLVALLPVVENKGEIKK